jgi:hypothetical protein
MPEYSVEFSIKLTECAQAVLDNGVEDFDAARTVWYLSLLASEVCLKALLEKTGQSVDKTHKHAALLAAVCKCEIKKEVTNGSMRPVSAMDLRSQVVHSSYTGLEPPYNQITVGALLEAQATGASKYPNEIRYGCPAAPAADRVRNGLRYRRMGTRPLGRHNRSLNTTPNCDPCVIRSVSIERQSHYCIHWLGDEDSNLG